MVSGVCKQYLASTVCQLSVLLVGAAYCWFEPITLRLANDPDLGLTSEDVSWLISIVEIGCLLTPMLSGYLADRYGRKLLILSVGPLCFLGWSLIPVWFDYSSLIAARLLHGLAVGVAYTVPPIYTAEIAEPKLRGRLAGSFQTALYIGTLIVFSIGPYLSYQNYAYACLPIPIVFLALFSFFPETPYYLLMRGREEEAKTVLRWFRDSPEVETELAAMKVAVEDEMSGTNSWRTLFFDRNERKSFLIVQVVCFAKFTTGMLVIINYAVETFSKSESFLPPEEMSIILAVLLSGIAVLSAFLSDWIGRKPLLLVSSFGCFVAHFLTGAYYFLHEKTTVDSKQFTWMLYLGLSTYCFFSDIGLGPLLQTLQSEMFGASTRGLVGGLTHAMAGVYSFGTLKAYAPVNGSWGMFVNFWFYSGVSLISGILLSWLMYETAGTTIGQKERSQKGRVEEGIGPRDFPLE